MIIAKAVKAAKAAKAAGAAKAAASHRIEQMAAINIGQWTQAINPTRMNRK